MSTPSLLGAADLSLPSITHILLAASEVFGLPVADIITRRRFRDGQFSRVCRARQVVAYVARHTSNRSWPMIARRLNRNHVTMMQGVEVIGAYIRRGHAETIADVARVRDRAIELHRQQEPMKVTA